ncbi:MAG: transposase [Candidatus Coatesbacteria bacterium]|nr:transposase [Candidatus Coatesbacteria bacterium]
MRMTHSPESRGARCKSPRLRGYDYTAGGTYFITVCTEGRRNILNDPEMIEMITSEWRGLEDRFTRAIPDISVVMPNHFHGVLFLSPRSANPDAKEGLADIVRVFKSVTTVIYFRSRGCQIRANDRHRLWQRSYHDRIIRNDTELARIREYIASNPDKWDLDRENLDRVDENNFYDWLSAQD